MYKWNGEEWYKAAPLHKRIRKWFFWLGGWEKPNCLGWRVFDKDYLPSKKMTREELDKHVEIINNMKTSEERDEYKRKHFKRIKRKLREITPCSFFGNTLTIQNFGVYISVRSGYLVINWNKHMGRKCYISPNGTPGSAHTWYWGTPSDIKKFSDEKRARQAEFYRYK